MSASDIQTRILQCHGTGRNPSDGSKNQRSLGVHILTHNDWLNPELGNDEEALSICAYCDIKIELCLIELLRYEEKEKCVTKKGMVIKLRLIVLRNLSPDRVPY